MALSAFWLAACLAFSAALSQPLIRTFGTCPEVNNYYINKFLPRVTGSGLNIDGVFPQLREATPFSSTPTRPGGPAGLILDAPKSPPKFIEFGNVTGGGVYDGKDDDDDDDAPVEGTDFSGTNVQVQGVDEADIIKTDGSTVYTIAGRKFSVVKVLNDGAGGMLTGSLRLPTYPDDMLLEKDFVVAIGRDDSYKRPVYPRYSPDPSTGEASTVLYQIYVGGDKPRLVSTLHLEGAYVRARETDGIARIVVKFSPLNSLWLYTPTSNVSSTTTRKWNRETLQFSRPGNWLPTYMLRKGSQRQYGVYAACDRMHFAPLFAGFSQLYVVTLPLANVMSPNSAASIISDADALYVTKTAMYVTTARVRLDSNSADSAARWGTGYRTSFHRFTLSDSGATYNASGSIAGSVINRFALHEHRGHFFVASTTGAAWWSGRSLSASRVTAFKIEKGSSRLRPISSVGNLGLGERIFAVRYRAAIAYVVTFRETDPLYIIDLSRPWDLVVRGELKIPGFSTYLHFVAPGRVLGVGKDVNANGVVTGTKVSLFDVSNQTNPQELAIWTLAGSASNAEWDNRAFLYWRRQRVAVMPLVVRRDDGDFVGAIVLRVSDKKIFEVGRVQHFVPGSNYHPRILRNLVIGKFLWSLSSQLLQVNELGQFQTRNRTDAVDISDNVEVRVPSLAGTRVFARYSWTEEARDLDTGTRFLTEKVGFSCPTGDSDGKYIKFSGDNTGARGNEDSTILIGKAQREGQFNKTTEVLFNAGWHGAEFQGDATLTVRLERVATGEVIPGTRLSLPINPGVQSDCSSTLVGTLSFEVGDEDVLITLRTI